jgi:hypothetical protein
VPYSRLIFLPPPAREPHHAISVSASDVILKSGAVSHRQLADKQLPKNSRRQNRDCGLLLVLEGNSLIAT